jgi:hypothetical protein
MKVSAPTAVALVLACNLTNPAWGGKTRLENSTKRTMYVEMTLVKEPNANTKRGPIWVWVNCRRCTDKEGGNCKSLEWVDYRTVGKTGNASHHVFPEVNGLTILLDPLDKKGASVTAGFMCEIEANERWEWNSIAVNSPEKNWDRLEIQGTVNSVLYPKERYQDKRSKAKDNKPGGWLELEYADTVRLGKGGSQRVVYNVSGTGQAHVMIDTTDVPGLVCETDNANPHTLAPGTNVTCKNESTEAGTVTGNLAIVVGIM